MGGPSSQLVGWVEAAIAHAAEAERRLAPVGTARAASFVQWVEAGHFTADREPVDFTQWRYLRQIYEAIPQDPTRFDLTIQKPAQAGASILSMLLSIWLMLRGRYQGAYYLPTAPHAMVFSKDRWVRLIRENKAVHGLMGDPETPHQRRVVDEGSASARRLLWSIVYFTYMGGAVTTESLPLDFLFFDEVQEMLLAEMEKASERLSASQLQTVVRVSTANFEDADINHYYKRSDQREFFTRCACPDGVNLTDYLDPTDGPLFIGRGNGTTPGIPREPFYVCPRCGTLLKDPQDGVFRALVPESRRMGFGWGQWLSPRQTPASILEKWDHRIDTKNFFNRVGGRTYTDPKTQPVTEAHCVAAQRPDLRWGPLAPQETDGVVMGIDQMGHDNRAVVKARVGGIMRYLWMEVIQDGDPWKRCAQLMHEFRVRVCAVEALPNFNEAHRFSREFDGRVFVVNYAELEQELVTWGDRPRDQVTVRKTDEEARARWSARVDQYRMMSWSLDRWAKGEVETPDVRALRATIKTPAGPQPTEICRMFWLHLQRVALVTERPAGKENERKLRRAVKKIGIDPHFAYANMLADVAWVRAWGTTGMLVLDEGATMAEKRGERPVKADYVDQVKAALPHHFAERSELTCGDCQFLDDATNRCGMRLFYVEPTMERCDVFEPMAGEDDGL